MMDFLIIKGCLIRLCTSTLIINLGTDISSQLLVLRSANKDKSIRTHLNFKYSLIRVWGSRRMETKIVSEHLEFLEFLGNLQHGSLLTIKRNSLRP